MKTNLIYFQTISQIDLRNARYQGFLNEKQQRHGFGILLDDDLTIYISQWQQDELSGKTLILQIDGTVMLGQCKSNNLHNVVLFKNNQNTILSRFKEGKPLGCTVAFDRNMANALVFNSSEITNKKISDKPFYNRFIEIKEIKKQKEIIHKIGQENNIQIGTLEIQFLQFLRFLYKKYEKHLALNKKQGGGYYFGFKNGIGVQFSLQGCVHQKIQILSMGFYGKLRVLQAGVKHHQKRCYQQGRFNIKQTITYTNLLERPQKCKQIHQNLHKQSLNYVSKYFYLKINLIGVFEEFIHRKLQKQFHKAVSRSHQRKNFAILQKSPKKSAMIDLQTNRKKIVKNQSFTNLTTRISKQVRERSDNNKSYLNEKGAEKDKSEQKVNKSQKKSTQFVKNKSTNNIKSKKQLFINNYKIIRQNSQTTKQFKQVNNSKQIIRQSTSPKNQMPSPKKNFIHIKATIIENKAQKVQTQQKQNLLDVSITRLNEQKIRQQLHLNELNEKYHLVHRSPPTVSNQIYLHSYRKDQLFDNISKKLLTQKSKKDMELQNQILGKDFMRHFQDIEKRRLRLLTDFKNLNQKSPHLKSIDYQKNHHIQTSQVKQFVLVQPPLSQKQNQNQKHQHRSRSRYNVPQNKGKIRQQKFK